MKPGPQYAALFLITLGRDLKIACRRRAGAVLPLLFFVLTASLFALALGPEPALLKKIGPGVIWVAGLLAVLLSLQGLFRADFQDGAIEQMLLSPAPRLLLVAARLFAQWCVTGLPLIIVSPVLGLLLGLDAHAVKVLFISLLLGVPYLNLVGALVAALTLGVRQAGALLSLLVLPLYIPVLIFGSHAVAAAANQQSYQGQLLWLGALLTLAAALAPPAISFALRLSCCYR